MPILRNLSLLLFFILTTQNVLYSQSLEAIEGLKDELQTKEQNPLESAYTKVSIANRYIYHNLDSATVYIDDVLKAIDQETLVLPDTFFRHFLIKAWTHQGKQEYSPAKVYMNKAYEIVKRKDNRKDEIEILINLGSLMVQTRDTSIFHFVDRELPGVDTTASRDDYIMYTLLHKYKSEAYAQKEEYEKAIKTLLNISKASFLEKIPNYKYGIRSSLSDYMAFMGDYKTAAYHLQEALRDSLFKHQRKRIHYKLADLYIDTDSINQAKTNLATFNSILPHTKVDERDYYYISAKVLGAEGESNRAQITIDSAYFFQRQFENSQELLDVMLFKASLCQFLPSKKEIDLCVNRLDSIMRQNESLHTSTNLGEVSRIKLLQKLIHSDKTLVNEFVKYEQHTSTLMRERIDPNLVAAVLAFDNEEKEYIINQMTKTNELQTEHLAKQTYWLSYSLGSLSITSIFAFFIYRLSVRRKEKVEKIAIEKIKLAEQAQREKDRITRHAAEERKLLEAKQLALKQRVNSIETANQKLEEKLSTKKDIAIIEEFNISTKTKTHKIKVAQLMYIVTEKDGCRFYLRESNFWITMPLKKVLTYLPKQHFVRIFRSTVVNVDFITAVNSKYIVLQNGHELVMSRTYREEVKKRVG